MWPCHDTSTSLNSSHSLPLRPTSSVLKCPSFRLLCWLPQSPGPPLTLRVPTWFLSFLTSLNPCCSLWSSVTLPLKHSISCTHISLLFFRTRKWVISLAEVVHRQVHSHAATYCLHRLPLQQSQKCSSQYFHFTVGIIRNAFSLWRAGNESHGDFWTILYSKITGILLEYMNHCWEIQASLNPKTDSW